MCACAYTLLDGKSYIYKYCKPVGCLGDLKKPSTSQTVEKGKEIQYYAHSWAIKVRLF